MAFALIHRSFTACPSYKFSIYSDSKEKHCSQFVCVMKPQKQGCCICAVRAGDADGGFNL